MSVSISQIIFINIKVILYGKNKLADITRPSTMRNEPANAIPNRSPSSDGFIYKTTKTSGQVI